MAAVARDNEYSTIVILEGGLFLKANNDGSVDVLLSVALVVENRSDRTDRKHRAFDGLIKAAHDGGQE